MDHPICRMVRLRHRSHANTTTGAFEKRNANVRFLPGLLGAFEVSAGIVAVACGEMRDRRCRPGIVIAAEIQLGRGEDALKFRAIFDLLLGELFRRLARDFPGDKCYSK